MLPLVIGHEIILIQTNKPLSVWLKKWRWMFNFSTRTCFFAWFLCLFSPHSNNPSIFSALVLKLGEGGIWYAQMYLRQVILARYVNHLDREKLSGENSLEHKFEPWIVFSSSILLLTFLLAQTDWSDIIDCVVLVLALCFGLGIGNHVIAQSI